jgi:hypothetical protein
MGREGGIDTLHLGCLDSFNKFGFQEESNEMWGDFVLGVFRE